MVASFPSLLDRYLTARADAQPGWEVVVRDDARVLERLARGQCDGLLADAWLEPDDLVHFALELGAFDRFAALPDYRQRRSIPASLFGKVLLAGTLPDARSLRQTGAVVFSSAAMLDQLGVNWYHTRTGGPRTGDERPFDVEALGDFLALISAEEYDAHALTLASWLRRQEGLTGAIWALDCLDVRIPKGRVKRGKRAETVHLKVAVLSVLTPHGALPLCWRFGTPQEGDIELARLLLADIATLWMPGACTMLLVDAGFLDGAWLADLHRQGTTVITRLREGMDPFEAARAYLGLQSETAPRILRGDPDAIGAAWREVALPKRPAEKERPLRREITGFTDWPGWENFGQDLALCLVRDSYADGRVELWCLMSTDPTMSKDDIYDAFRQRWHLEETYMALARYHHLNALPASRVGVACARVHALLFAYTLRALCRRAMRRQQQAAGGGKPWRRRWERFIAYSGGAFAILRPSEVLEVILTHADVWRERQADILTALRYCEGSL